MKIAVVVASKGRPLELGRLLTELARQSHLPDQLVLSLTAAEDVPVVALAHQLVLGSPGLAAQRNRGLEQVRSDIDLIAFLDDDYRPAVDALEGMARLFSSHLDLAGANGCLLADGINTSGLSEQEAADLIAKRRCSSSNTLSLHELSGLYGCNMVFRASLIGRERFDEALPLYGWQEDYDFASRVRRFGRLVGTNAFFGVHLGTKGARTSGLRLGYSQISNPIYLVRKGTMAWYYALKLIASNVAANHIKMLSPEPWTDRRGRACGNWRALGDACLGKLHPRRILDL